MADKVLRILGVHGLGDHRTSNWEEVWQAAVKTAFAKLPETKLEFSFVTYDDIFEDTEISFIEAAEAVWLLTKSGVSSLGPRQRGVISDISDRIKWTAGYIVAWVNDDDFKRQSRKRILDAVRTHKPDVILAHSLGSMVTYDAFSHPDAKEAAVSNILAKTSYVTLGSQIGNPFVVGNLTNGRIVPPGVRFWYHLFNPHDSVFTAEIRLPDKTKFSQTNTPFDIDGIADHAAENYLGHPATIANVWARLGVEKSGAKGLVPAAMVSPRAAERRARETRKALLIGINDYPDPAQRLEGCINDVFTMSSVLQEFGFRPESIRTCLDDRATADGILSRLKWLLDDPQPNDELVFYYSGHGARVPEYGENFEPDHHVETLVPWDFDWSQETMVSDDQIFELYSQLPYDTRLLMIFDCCHSGGIHRNGGPKPKGIAPPDDIRHRELKWDRKTEMWVNRKFTRMNEDFTPEKDVAAKFFGNDGATARLGRAGMLRGISEEEYRQLKRDKAPTALGPYLPLIIEACGEEDFSYEYKHGAESHGAFTFSLASILRRQKTAISFQKLAEKTRDQLAELRYAQTPQILGPTHIVKSKVPWRAG
jgi:hypothetical protein